MEISAKCTRIMFHHFENDWSVHHFTENKNRKRRERKREAKTETTTATNKNTPQNHLSHSQYPRCNTLSALNFITAAAAASSNEDGGGGGEGSGCTKKDSFLLRNFSVHNYYMQSERNIPKEYFITFHIRLLPSTFMVMCVQAKRMKTHKISLTGCAQKWTDFE